MCIECMTVSIMMLIRYKLAASSYVFQNRESFEKHFFSAAVFNFCF